MENLIVTLLSDEALQELKEMERTNKIQILNEAEVAGKKVNRELMLKEIDDYTFENILKSLKKNWIADEAFAGTVFCKLFCR